MKKQLLWVVEAVAPCALGVVRRPGCVSESGWSPVTTMESHAESGAEERFVRGAMCCFSVANKGGLQG